MSKMERTIYVLAVLSSIKDSVYSPVQIQKIFFLLDRTLGNRVNGSYFNFEPYHYGPFDKNVYKEIDKLSTENFITLSFEFDSGIKQYKVTESGIKNGNKALLFFEKNVQFYIKEICSYVKSLSFEQLIKAIYKEYPEMKVNSVFS